MTTTTTSYNLERQVELGSALACDDCGMPRTRATRKKSRRKGRCLACMRHFQKMVPVGMIDSSKVDRPQAVTDCVDCHAALHPGARWKNSKTGRPTIRCRNCSKKYQHELKRMGGRASAEARSGRGYVDGEGRWHLYGKDAAWGALANAWKAFRIARGKNDLEKQRELAEKINELEVSLGKNVTNFQIINY